MKAYSILVGKCYRTPSGEVREASSNVDEEITYTVYENGDGKSKVPARRVPLGRFAREVEGEVSCPQPEVTSKMTRVGHTPHRRPTPLSM
jgi:hypothetical protein